MAVYGRWGDCAAQMAGQPGFARAFEFVGQVLDGSHEAARTLAGMREGETQRLALDGERLFAMLQCGPTKPREQAPLESHRRYADVQVVVNGSEEMDVTPVEGLAPSDPFDVQKDLRFYVRPSATSRLIMRDGLCAVLFPSDAHAPMVAPDGQPHLSRRIVVKVQV